MTLQEVLPLGLAFLALAVGLVMYMRHGHRRLYRELRQLRESGNQTLRLQDLEQVRVSLAQGIDQANRQVATHMTDLRSSMAEELERASSVRLQAAETQLLGWQSQVQSELEQLTRGVSEIVGTVQEIHREIASLNARHNSFRSLIGEVVESKFSGIHSAIGARLDALEEGAASREAQLRAQLALRHQEFEQAYRDALQAELAQQAATLLEPLDRLERYSRAQLEPMGDTLATVHAESSKLLEVSEFIRSAVAAVDPRLFRLEAETARSIDQLAALIDAAIQSRAESLEAGAVGRDAQLRAQLALRHAEFEDSQRAALLTLGRNVEASWRESETRLQGLGAAMEDLRSELATQGQALASLPNLGSVAMSTESMKPLQRLQNDVEFIKHRMSSYLGEGMGLTHLVDETPIYLNTSDIGCPANFINGGRYEEEYLQVLASFCQPDSVFLDIGANLGVFSLRMAPYLRQGRIFAFEPNSRIRDLFGRSVHLNGLREQVTIFDCGASDESAELVLDVPPGHAGGGNVQRADPGDTRARIQVRPLDEVLGDLPSFHVAKIDVEGHELQALRGMRKLLARSPRAVVLFEKLIPNAGLEAPVLELFSACGMRLWRIDGVRLLPVDLGAFEASSAYFLAARPETIGDELDRGFLRIQPGHLLKSQAQERAGILIPAPGPHAAGTHLFHGPYWYLPRGVYRVEIQGTIGPPLQVQIAEKFGQPVARATVSGASPRFEFTAERDLTHFEIVGRATDEDPAFEIEHLHVTRIA
jgi:FkbM family methyltransferase